MTEDAGHVVVVVGMHRSGTSAITRALLALGVPLGSSLLAAAADNPTGFWEDMDCLEINNHLLRRLGAAHDRFLVSPAFADPDAQLDALRSRALAVVADRVRAGGGTWGFKDPRTARLLGFWRPLLEGAGYRLSFVLASRHPASVANSLRHRDGMPLEQSCLLWLEHVEAAVRMTQDTTRIVVDYDGLLDDPMGQIARLNAWLGHSADHNAAEIAAFAREFLDPALRHLKPQAAPIHADLPQPVQRAYSALSAAAAALPRRADAALDEAFRPITQEIKALAPAFATINFVEDKCEGMRIDRDAHFTAAQQAGAVTEYAQREKAEQQARAERAEQAAHAERQRAEAAEQQTIAAEAWAASALQMAAAAEAQATTAAARTAALEAQLTAVNLHVMRIEASRGWRILRVLQRLRNTLAWPARAVQRKPGKTAV